MRIARAAWPVIARSLIAAGIGLLLSRWPQFATGGKVVAAVAGVWALFSLYFFRDPRRPPPPDSDKLYAPGDGRVLTIMYEGLGNEVTVRIFLSIFNVHLQRAPCAGKVLNAQHVPGSFQAAMFDSAKGNERCDLRLAPEGRESSVVVVAQIAGLIARRIECWAAAGERLRAGQRYGIIHYGSQVAVTLPVNTRLLVSPGDRVYAGLTPIAQWTS